MLQKQNSSEKQNQNKKKMILPYISTFNPKAIEIYTYIELNLPILNNEKPFTKILNHKNKTTTKVTKKNIPTSAKHN